MAWTVFHGEDFPSCSVPQTQQEVIEEEISSK